MPNSQLPRDHEGPALPGFVLHSLGPGFLFALLASAVCLAADAPRWLDRFHVAWGLDGPPAALVEYRGDLIAAGAFAYAGSIKMAHVGRWDGTAWYPMGDGLDAGVCAIAVVGDSLYAGGWFTRSGNRQVQHLARWDGSSWQPVGGGLDGPCFTLAVNADTLVVGGRFERAGDTSIPKIAAWAGGTWHGPGADAGDLAGVDVTGLAVAGGSVFATWRSKPPEHHDPGDVPHATQNGFLGRVRGHWRNLGYLTPEFSFTPTRLAVLDGKLVAAGTVFRDAYGHISFSGAVARLTDDRWEILGSEFTSWNIPNALGVVRGQIVIAQADAAWQLNGSTWEKIEGSPRRVGCFAEYHGNLVIGGDFPSAGGVPAREIATLEGLAWRPFGPGTGDGIEGTVLDLVSTSRGIHAWQWHWWAGSFLTPECRTWDGSRWNVIPLPTDRLPASVVAWHDLLAATGVIAPCSGYPTLCSGLGTWDGRTWTIWEDMLGAKISAVLSQPSRLVVAGQLPAVSGGGRSISAWDGASWSSWDGDLTGTVTTMTSFHGDPIAWGILGTDLLPIDFRAARWTGESWELLVGTAPFRVRAAIAVANQLVVAWDDFATLEYWEGTVSGVSRRTDQGWSPLGDQPDHAIRALAMFHGALIAGGDFTRFGSTEARGLARWDGTAWQPYAGGIDGSVSAIEVRGDSLWVGGSFRFAGGVPSFNVGVYVEPSPSPVSLVASSRDSTIAVDWTLPGDAEVAGAVLRASPGDYPADPADGEPVAGGADGRFPGSSGASFHLVLPSPKDGSRVYYTAFAYTPAGSYSSPSHAMAVTPDRIAPILAVHVERSRNDGDSLAVLLRSSEPLDSTDVRVRIGDVPLPMRPLSRWGTTWHGTIDLAGASMGLPIAVEASDSAGNRARTLVRIAARSLRAGHGGYLALPAETMGGSGSFGIEIPPGGARRDAIVTILPADLRAGTSPADSTGVISAVLVQPVDLLKARVYVTFHYETATVTPSDADRLYIMGDNGPLPSYLDPENHTISATADRLGGFRLVRGGEAANQPADASVMEATVIGPNPFEGATRLRVEIRTPQQLRITIHDITGRQVRRLWDRPVLPGPLEFGWDGHATDGREVPAGLYYCRVHGERATKVIRLVRL